MPRLCGARSVRKYRPAGTGPIVVLPPPFPLMLRLTRSVSYCSVSMTTNLRPAFTSPGASNAVMGGAKPVANVLSPPAAGPSGFLA